MKLSVCLLGLAFAAVVVVACSTSATTPSGPQDVLTTGNPHNPGHKRHRDNSPGTITKVFVIVQENRTVDNLFNGFPNANTQNYGYFGNTKIPLKSVALATPFDLNHSLAAFNSDTGCPSSPYLTGGTEAFPCPMNGFQTAPPSGPGPNAYQYVSKSDTKPYWSMAQQYVFGDDMFQSNLDGSYTSHQYLVAGQANSATDFPAMTSCNVQPTPNVRWVTSNRQYGQNPKYITACQSYSTILPIELQKKSKKWRYYTAMPTGSGLAYWDPFFYIISGYPYYGYSNGSIVKPPCQFLTDIANPSGYAPSVTWITPSFTDSDHANGTVNHYGPDWVAAVVNAIGQSSYWDQSVIFITWDDWGGWYDHVNPPYADYDGLGVRVPFIIISPWVKSNYVTHVQYEQASIMRYIEDLFSLKQMAASDTRANDPANDNFWNASGTAPRPFATISPYPDGYNCNAEGPPDTE